MFEILFVFNLNFSVYIYNIYIYTTFFLKLKFVYFDSIYQISEMVGTFPCYLGSTLV